MSPSVAEIMRMDDSAHHHRLAGIYEFRLQGSKEDTDRMTSSADTRAIGVTTATSSVYSDPLSFYKQRIDSMFDETKSSISGGGTPTISRRGRTVLDDLEEEDEEEYDDAEDKTPNTVQERIQKMFADVTEDERKNFKNFGENRNNGKPKTTNTTNPASKLNITNKESFKPTRSQIFPVHYLGSVPLPDRNANLQALQTPLKNLYFRYRKLEICGRSPPLDGTLEISDKGLKMTTGSTGDDGKPVTGEEVKKLNKFPSIAVWAAVKFVNREAENKMDDSTRYAFLPLISDPDGRDKSSLFQALPMEDLNYARGAHSPMFVVVMRRSARNSNVSAPVKRSLYCYAFICACSEDAIVMAANLYQALVAGMSGGKKGKPKSEDETKQENATDESVSQEAEESKGINPTRFSVKKASSIDGGDLYGRNTPQRFSDVMSTSSVPVRPPRRKKYTSRSGEDARSTNSEEQVSMEEDDELKLVTQGKMGHHSSSPLSGAQSATKLNTQQKDATGDILTRVAIPRTGSFLDHGAAIRRSSSLGLGDLFQEVRAQEGLMSLDAILEKIVDADGMSFARLKPLYREFLIKLAATLSRDELYQRSKTIMRRQASLRRRRRRRRPLSSRESQACPRADEDTSSASGEGRRRKNGRFSWALCSSVHKTRGKSSKNARSVDTIKDKRREENSQKCSEGVEGTSCNFEFTSVIFPSRERMAGARAGSSSISSSISSTSRASKSRRQKRKMFHAHRPSFNAGRSIRGSHAHPPRSSAIYPSKDESEPRPRFSNSEDSSDFFSFKRKTVTKYSSTDTNTKSSSRMGGSSTVFGGGRSSSGYVSCSDCSFDSESCNSDKCYCPQEPNKKHQWNRLRSKESNTSNRFREHTAKYRIAETGYRCCDSGRHVAPLPCRARVGSCSGCVHRGNCEVRCGSAAPTCAAHVAVTTNHCDMCMGIRKCGCSAWRTTHHADSTCEGPRRRPERKSAMANGNGGVEFLDEDDWEDESAAVIVEDGNSATSSSSWRPGAAVPKSRMEVYATLPPPRPLPDTSTALNGSTGVYDTCANKNHENTCRARAQMPDAAHLEGNQQKVLVVSARDPRGRVICMGREDHVHHATPPFGGHRVLPCIAAHHCSKSAANEALSVKKSAEIAALFSDVRSNHKTQVVVGEEVVYTTLEPPKSNQSQGSQSEAITKRKYYVGNSLENTLGYLP